ncbi:hypothetical protein ACQY0O_001988 [Thecaphora frezii]
MAASSQRSRVGGGGKAADASDAEANQPSRPSIARKPSTPKLYQVARVTQLATDDAQVDAPDNQDVERPSASKLDKVDRGILSRIQKSLRLAKHPGTGEAEARQALRLATRLMASQNLTQADLIASEDANTAQSRAGMSHVEIISTTGSMVRNESWANRIAVAINLFFSVKAYSTSHMGRDKLTWTFYGLAINTVAAATAFEMVHNQVLTWAADNKEAKGKTGKNSYCQGVAAGLVDMAKQEKKEEMQLAVKAEKKRLRQAERQEKKEQAKQLERLRGPAETEEHRQAKVEEDDDDDNHNNEWPPLPRVGAEVVKAKRSPSMGRDISLGRGNHGSRIKPEPSEYALGRDRFSTKSGNEGDDDDDLPADDYPTLSEIEVKVRLPTAADAAAVLFGCSPPSICTSALLSPTGLTSFWLAAHDAVTAQPDFDEELEKDIIDLTNDTDEEQESKREVEVKAEQIEIKHEDQDGEAQQARWRDSGQLTLFRQNAERIADDYLKSVHGQIKLRKRQASSYMKDKQAYEQGRRDAKKIDVKRRRITDN